MRKPLTFILSVAYMRFNTRHKPTWVQWGGTCLRVCVCTSWCSPGRDASLWVHTNKEAYQHKTAHTCNGVDVSIGRCASLQFRLKCVCLSSLDTHIRYSYVYTLLIVMEPDVFEASIGQRRAICVFTIVYPTVYYRCRIGYMSALCTCSGFAYGLVSRSLCQFVCK